MRLCLRITRKLLHPEASGNRCIRDLPNRSGYSGVRGALRQLTTGGAVYSIIGRFYSLHSGVIILNASFTPLHL